MTEPVDWGANLLRKITDKDATEYHHNTFAWLQELARSVKFNKRDAQIAFTGARSKGKSSAALAISMMLTQPELGCIVFDMKLCTCFSVETIGEIIRSSSAESEHSYIMDESLDIVDSRDSLSRMNKAINKFMNSARKMRNIYSWCVPEFTDLDTRIRKNIIKYWIHMYHQTEHEERDKRYAIGALFMKDLNPGNKDKWGLEFMEKWKKPIYDHEGLYKMFRRTPSFCGNLAFPILPQSIEDEYEAISKQAIGQRGTDFNRDFGKKPIKTDDGN